MEYDTEEVMSAMASLLTNSPGATVQPRDIAGEMEISDLRAHHFLNRLVDAGLVSRSPKAAISPYGLGHGLHRGPRLGRIATAARGLNDDPAQARWRRTDQTSAPSVSTDAVRRAIFLKDYDPPPMGFDDGSPPHVVVVETSGRPTFLISLRRPDCPSECFCVRSRSFSLNPGRAARWNLRPPSGTHVPTPSGDERMTE